MPRLNQKTRTRKDLLQATARLMKQNIGVLTLDAIAEEAQVSRSTAYRYFPSVDSAVVEASLDVDSPDPERLFSDSASIDPVTRVLRVDESFRQMIAANEKSLRQMLIHSLQYSLKEPDVDIPTRQNRRTPLIEQALAPVRAALGESRFQTLVSALAMVIGTESMLVCKDVLQLSDSEMRKAKEFAIRALVDAALNVESTDGRKRKKKR